MNVRVCVYDWLLKPNHSKELSYYLMCLRL